MPRIVAAKCPWPGCAKEWTDEQREAVLWEIGYLQPGGDYAGRGVRGTAHCPVCKRIVKVIANPGLPLIVARGKPELRIIPKCEEV